MCKGCGHIIVLNWPEHCPKCKRTGFVKPEPKKPADGVKEDGNG
jgi:predicted Zn-ribbon and HTH transcriptional regulator